MAEAGRVMSQPRQALGKWGEERAADYLSTRGYLILGRNIRTPFGELDIVASHDETIVFIEVKTRTSRRYGWPEEGVTQRKQAHLRSAAEAYLLDHPELEGGWRIDVIAIEGRMGDPSPTITHFVDAVF
jgi:putative endonuclease